MVLLLSSRSTKTGLTDFPPTLCGKTRSPLRLPCFHQVEETVREQLGLPNLVAMLTGLLGETDVQLYLAGVVILGKVSMTARTCSILPFHTLVTSKASSSDRDMSLRVQGGCGSWQETFHGF